MARTFKNQIILNIAVCSILLFITFLLYGQAVNLWWTFDDTQILKQAIKYSPWQYFLIPKVWLQQHWNVFMPLLTLSFELDFSLFGLDPKMFYIHQLVSLSLCSILLFYALRLWLPKAFAFFGACIFLLGLPLTVVSQQLMTRHYIEGLLFSLLAFIFYVKGLRENKAWMILCSAFLYLIAVSAKEIYVPLVLFLIILPEKDFKTRLRQSLPLFAVLFIYLFWRKLMLGVFVGGHRFVEMKEVPAALLLIISNLRGPAFNPQTLMGKAIVYIFIVPIAFLLFQRPRTAIITIGAGLLTLLPLISAGAYEAIGPRFLFLSWLMFAALFVFALRHLWKVNAIGRIFSLLLAILMIFYLLPHNRDAWTRGLDISKRFSAEGRFFLYEAGKDDLLRKPVFEGHYFEGLDWLKQGYYKRHDIARYFYDDIYLCETVLYGEKFWSYSETERRIVDITNSIPEIKENYCRNLVVMPITVKVAYNYDSFELSWSLGPYEKGQYSFILENGAKRFDVPPKSKIRILLRPEDNMKFRIRYESQSGQTTYSPLLIMEKTTETHASVYWNGG